LQLKKVGNCYYSMKEKAEENVFQINQQDQNELDKDWKKSIPAQVFLNYFFAINYHLKNSESNGVEQLAILREGQQSLDANDIEVIKRHLTNCWSTEYALRATAELGDEAYMRNALHWTFPQAYYAIFAGLQAFLHTRGLNTNNEGWILREAGRLIVKNAYPKAIGFYASGHYDDFNVHRLPLAHYKPGLQIAGKELEAQAQIGQFLRTTRRQKAKVIRKQVQANPTTAIRSTKTGDVLQKFSPQHWQQLTWRIGYTTLFDLMARLRISSSHREIERFVQSDIDFKLFHESLLEIVSYLNGIHESYVAQAIGIKNYTSIISELPKYLQNSFVAARLEKQIMPLLGEEEYQLGQAA
jgi:hypothetical protein